MGEFILDEISLDPFEVEDNLLSLDSDEPNMDSDFMELEYGDEINIDSPIREKSPEQLSEEIEDLFISLLAQDDINTILALTGESPYATDVVSEDFFKGFTGSYMQAVLFNPAIKWYSKLLKMLPEGKFAIEGGNLKLKISPQFFKKTLYPFLGDFKIGLREDSPIVNLIYNLAESVKDKSVQDNLDILNQTQKSRSLEEDGLNPGSMDFQDSMLDTQSVEADLTLDDSDSLGGTSFDFTDNNSINIKLQDLANKTISQYLIEHNVVDQEMIVNKLSEEGFPRRRIHEILGIMNYMLLEDSLPRQMGNKGGGNIEFSYR